MAASTGKRKRDDDTDGTDDGSEDEGAMRARFQRAFEAKFRPLERSTFFAYDEAPVDDDDSDAGSDESDWDGLPDDEGLIEVGDYEATSKDSKDPQAREKRAFMSSRPPEIGDKAVALPTPETLTPDEDSSEAVNLKHDLALQRLLKESHLLDSSSFSRKASAPEGKCRIKALDLRIRGLGARESISNQEKMPLSHRRGISTKAATREEKRRKDAAENGVILEKAKSALKPGKRRERSVGGPTVGKFKGGLLKLSSKDLRSIEGPKQRGWGGRKGRK